MTFTLNANRRLIIHDGKLQMMQIEQHAAGFVIIHETKRTIEGEPQPTRKAAQAELARLAELAIRALPVAS